MTISIIPDISGKENKCLLAVNRDYPYPGTPDIGYLVPGIV